MAWVEDVTPKRPDGSAPRKGALRRYRGVYRDAAGRKQRSPVMLSKEAARDWARRAEQRSKAGQNPAAGRMKLREWAALWHDARDVEKTTATYERYRIDAVIEEWGEWRIDSITSMAIKGWVKRLGHTRKPGTVRKYFYILSSMLTAAVVEGLRPDNPCRHVEIEKPPTTRVFLTSDELDRVVALMPDPYDVVAYVLAWTGLRFGEIAGLSTARDHLDLMRGEIHVIQTLIEIDGVFEIKKKPKTPESIRVVVLHEHVTTALAEHLRRHPSPDGLVFHGRRGSPLSRHQFGRVWHKAREAAGVKHARPHDLRHSNASWLVQSGKVQLYDVQAHLGHGDIRTTQLYADLAGSHHSRVRSALAKPDQGASKGQPVPDRGGR